MCFFALGKCVIFHSVSLSSSVGIGEMISFKIAYFTFKMPSKVQTEQKLSSRKVRHIM